ncbi:hypothetical protein CHS0354_015899 [Potamilus streckersoni]|uniref:Uncharacterized protein n=1 Tax=Potamilus streckersoni TaxID=2493646 RepID=A0AAE0VTC3_9BIVA|nr:hypothetical protein CHS0354_015899 [Potamilus streckersoni]
MEQNYIEVLPTSVSLAEEKKGFSLSPFSIEHILSMHQGDLSSKNPIIRKGKSFGFHESNCSSALDLTIRPNLDFEKNEEKYRLDELKCAYDSGNDVNIMMRDSDNLMVTNIAHDKCEVTRNIKTEPDCLIEKLQNDLVAEAEEGNVWSDNVDTSDDEGSPTLDLTTSFRNNLRNSRTGEERKASNAGRCSDDVDDNDDDEMHIYHSDKSKHIRKDKKPRDATLFISLRDITTNPSCQFTSAITLLALKKNNLTRTHKTNNNNTNTNTNGGRHSQNQQQE